MSRHKSIVALCCTLCLAISMLGVNCGKVDDGKKDTKTDTVTPGSKEDHMRRIEANLNDALTRLRLGDKSGLWENEFDYLLDKETFDFYLSRRELEYSQADTLMQLDVNDVRLFMPDSAMAFVTIHFEGPTGMKTLLDDSVKVYYHNERWIKPTVSVISQQVSYDSLIHLADSAAAADDIF